VVKYRLSVVEITVMVKQFTFGLCGLLRKSKLSLVSVNSVVLQVTSDSLREAGRILWNFCMLRISGNVSLVGSPKMLRIS
jgi:hypothetical protein